MGRIPMVPMPAAVTYREQGELMPRRQLMNDIHLSPTPLATRRRGPAEPTNLLTGRSSGVGECCRSRARRLERSRSVSGKQAQSHVRLHC